MNPLGRCKGAHEELVRQGALARLVVEPIKFVNLDLRVYFAHKAFVGEDDLGLALARREFIKERMGELHPRQPNGPQRAGVDEHLLNDPGHVQGSGVEDIQR